MTDLDQILASANYQATIKQQRELLEIKFQDECVYAHNGGLFDITPEFLAGIELRAKYSASNAIWIVDRNKTSILIKDVEAFVREAVEKYNTAAEEYGAAWQSLRTKRNAKAIIET